MGYCNTDNKCKCAGLRLKRMSVLLVLIFSVLCVYAQSPAAKFAGSDAVRADKCAVMIVNLQNGEVVDSHNADSPLIPASVTKAVTIASTLSESGVNYKYHTRVYMTGPVEDGELKGNLLIVGSGDPSLGADVEPRGSDFIFETVRVLKKRGVKRIAGKITIDGSVFPGPAVPPSWAAGDLKHAYGTGCHGFNWQRNASGKVAVSNPSSAFISQLTSALKRDGITVEGGSYSDHKKGKPVLDHASPTIDEIMRSCMKRSDNLYAEALLRTFAMLKDKPADTKEGAGLEMDHWKAKGADMEYVWIVDGSGLSRYNRLTAKFLADVLVKMAWNADYASFFPLAGQEGTLSSFLKGTRLEGYIAMKTGSMSGVQCYAGYMLDDNYAPTHVVVIMINDFKGARSAVKKAAETMLLETF